MGKPKQSNSSKSNSNGPAPNASPAPPSTVAPARRKAAVLKSGNAGSSKAAEEAKAVAQANPSPAALLFGSNWTGKTPLSLLHEHCQKRGWDKPVIDAKKNAGGDTFTGIVILKRKDDSVLLKPQEEVGIACPTALEARHRAAVYGLFRFANNLNLKMTLPPMMRDYWGQLDKFRQATPKDKAWWWAQDPFAAKAQHQQAMATPQNNGGGGAGGGSTSSSGGPKIHGRNGGVFDNSIPEFRLSRDLQDRADVLLRKRMARSQPASGQATPIHLTVTEAELASVQRHLHQLGFAHGHIQSALSWLNTAAASSTDRFVQDLLASSSLKDAAVTYLQLTLSHAQLPPLFQNSNQGSKDNSIKLSKATDTKSLAQSWQAQKAHDETGFPLDRVAERLRLADGNIGLALDCLLRDLCGLQSDETWSSQRLLQAAHQATSEEDTSHRQEIEERWSEEVEVLESVYAERFTRSLDKQAQLTTYRLSSSARPDVGLMLVRHAASRYPTTEAAAAGGPPSLPTAVIVSQTLPPYMRLALSKRLFERMTAPDAVELAQEGQGGLLCTFLTDIQDQW